MTNQKLKETIVSQAVEIAELKESLRLEEFSYKVRTEEAEKLKKEVETFKSNEECSNLQVLTYARENDNLKATIAELEKEIKEQNVAWEELLTDMYHYRDKYEELKAEKEERQTATISADEMIKEAQNG